MSVKGSFRATGAMKGMIPMNDLRKRLEARPIEGSAACRIDCGGTLDIKTFYYPLRHLSPCTFNIALDMKTRVRLLPNRSGLVRVSSRGFESAEHEADKAPFDSPLGLMFAVAAYFRVGGVHIEILSESPPRSALGGSSTAAVALVGALSQALRGDASERPIGHEKVALLAHAIEEAVAGVPCGLQDQLAAVYGGVHVWYWPSDPMGPPFKKVPVLTEEDYEALEKRLLLAYSGIPHESRDINSKWVKQFVTGRDRSLWAEIVTVTKRFVEALRAKDWAVAVEAMNREVEIRMEMTPEVLDGVGRRLLECALAHGCGARFTGSGGGGCLCALGESKDIERLRPVWTDVLAQGKDAKLLDTRVDPKGLEVI
jgi:D-glycero-alpha-D-manno-heptose-7-phosphate kinase